MIFVPSSRLSSREPLVDAVVALQVVGREQARHQAVGRDAALAEEAAVGAADEQIDGVTTLRRHVRPAGLLDRRERAGRVPGRQSRPARSASRPRSVMPGR